MFFAPIKGGLVDVQTDCGVGLSAFDPFDGGVARAAEIFSQGAGFAPPDGLVLGIDEVDLRFDILDRVLVQLMAISGQRGQRTGLGGFLRGFLLDIGLSSRFFIFGLNAHLNPHWIGSYCWKARESDP